MRKLLFVLLIGSSFLALAHQEPKVTTEVTDHITRVLLYENESVTITGESYEVNGGHYLKVVFLNKTSEALRAVYSISIHGERQLINYDGTVEAVVSLGANGTFTYGDSNESHPIIELNNDWMSTTKIQLTILH